MPAKAAKKSEEFFDGSASYLTDEHARLGRHFHRRKKTDKHGWWEKGVGETSSSSSSSHGDAVEAVRLRDGMGAAVVPMGQNEQVGESGSRGGFLLRANAPEDTDGAIKFYSDQMRKFSRYDFPEEWATCHATNAKLFADRSGGKRENNIENGLYHVQNALQVFTAATHPLPWSDLAMLACGLFKERVGLREKKALRKLATGAAGAMADGERALENAEAALTVLAVEQQPVRFARAQREIALCHMKRFEGDEYHVDEQESVEVSIRAAENALDVFKEMLDVEKNPKNHDKKVKNKLKRDVVLSTVTGDTEDVFLKYELGKCYYVLGITYARRHGGSVMKNHVDSLDYLKRALDYLPSRSKEWLQSSAMLAKAHADVDTPDAANAGEDFGEVTDDHGNDTAVKHLNNSLEQVDKTNQKAEWGELQWQLGYMAHLKLRKMKGGDGKGELSEAHKEAAAKLVEVCIDHLSNALTVIVPSTAPSPDRYCAVHSVIAATHTIRADVLTVGTATTMDVLEAQATLAEAVGHYMAACSEWNPEAYPEQFALTRSRIGETFVKMGELGKAAKAYRGAMLAAGMLCNVTSYDKAAFADGEDKANSGKRPWKVWCRVAGIFEASAEICACRALVEGGEERALIPRRNGGEKEKWIFILDLEEIAEIEEAKRKAKEAADRIAGEEERASPIKSGLKKSAGVADWETADDQYDATEDMGGEFDVTAAMKERDAANRNKLLHGDRSTFSHMLEQEKKVAAAVVKGDDGTGEKPVGRAVVSGWRSRIMNPFGKKETTGKAKIAPAKIAPPSPDPKTPGKDRGTSAPSASDTLRKKQKAEALSASASNSKGKAGKGDSSVPLAPSHILAPQMPPPASALLTAAGAIVPLAPKGIAAPKGPPPKAAKSTVEERFIRAVWNLDDEGEGPAAPGPHVRAIGGGDGGSNRPESFFDRVKKHVGSSAEFVRIKYGIVMSIGKMYHYHARVIAHPRALEALHICCRAASVKFVEGCKAVGADAGRRALEEMEMDLFYKTSRKFVASKARLRTAIFTVKKLEDEVRKQKHEFSSAEKGIQWLSTKSLNLGKVVTEVKRLEDVIRKDVQRNNGFLSMLDTVPINVMTPSQLVEHDARKRGLPHNSLYPADRDLLKTVTLYEAKVIWYMSEEHGIARDTGEQGIGISGDGKVGSQALFCAVIYRDLVRFTSLGRRIPKEKAAVMDKVEAKVYAEAQVMDELEMKKIQQMKPKDAKKAMQRRRARIRKRENLKQKGSGYVRVPGDVKVKLLCCEAADCKKSVEVAVAAYIDAARTKQYHKRAFLLEKALKFLGDSLGVHRLVEALPGHVDSVCLIPQGVMRLAPLHALPIPSPSGGGGKVYRGETLMDRFTVRYCGSLPMSDFCDLQAEWAKECTPWHYRKCAVIADPVKNHPASRPVMRLSEMEGKVVRSVWSNDDSDTSLLIGERANCNVALVAEKLVEDGETKGHMKEEADRLKDMRRGGGGGGGGRGGRRGGGRRRMKKKKVRTQVQVSEGVWEDMAGSSSSSSSDDDSDSDSGGESPTKKTAKKGRKKSGGGGGGSDEEDSDDDDEEDADSDEEDNSMEHDHVLSVCRVLHLSAPVNHQPHPEVLLAPPPPVGDGQKVSKDVFISNGAAHYSAKSILKTLHMKHCGLVFLSRGASAQTATVSSDMSNLKSKRAIGIDIADTFILAGAQTVLAPLWADESTALSTILFTIKFYDELVDCADEARPVAVAVKHTQSWLKNATFASIRSAMWASRVDRIVLEELDEELWAIALAQKMLKGQGNFGGGGGDDDRWDRMQKDAKPFASPFYWAPFRCTGSCGGVHDPRVAERDHFDNFQEDEKMEKHLEEFDEGEGHVDAYIVKGARAVGGAIGGAAERAGDHVADKLQAPVAALKDRATIQKNRVKVQIESAKARRIKLTGAVSEAAKERGERAKAAIRNAPKAALAKVKKERANLAERKRGELANKFGGTGTGKEKEKKKKREAKKKGKKKYEDDGSSSGSSSDGGEEDEDENFGNFGAGGDLRRLRQQRLNNNDGSKACSVM